MLTNARQHLVHKAACYNCEQTGHMTKDCPKKDIKALEESEKEDP